MTPSRFQRTTVRGLSLVETIVYCILLGLFTSIFFVSLPARGNASSENLSDSVEQASLALSRLNKGLSNSPRDKVFVKDDGKTLIFLSATDESHPKFAYDKSGSVLWRHWNYYSLEKDQVSHYEVPLKGLMSLSEIERPTFENPSKSYARKRLVSNVSVFEVKKTDLGYHIILELNTDGSTYGSETLARPRN